MAIGPTKIRQLVAGNAYGPAQRKVMGCMQRDGTLVLTNNQIPTRCSKGSGIFSFTAHDEVGYRLLAEVPDSNHGRVFVAHCKLRPTLDRPPHWRNTLTLTRPVPSRDARNVGQRGWYGRASSDPHRTTDENLAPWMRGLKGAILPE